MRERLGHCRSSHNSDVVGGVVVFASCPQTKRYLSLSFISESLFLITSLA